MNECEWLSVSLCQSCNSVIPCLGYLWIEVLQCLALKTCFYNELNQKDALVVLDVMQTGQTELGMSIDEDKGVYLQPN